MRPADVILVQQYGFGILYNSKVREIHRRYYQALEFWQTAAMACLRLLDLVRIIKLSIASWSIKSTVPSRGFIWIRDLSTYTT